MQYKYAPYKSKSVKGRTRKSTPHSWKSGPDPYQHELYYAWQKHRAQARFRDEGYLLTFEDWQQIWANPEDFFRRGRTAQDLTLTRCDPEKPWAMDNVEIILRVEQLRREIKRRNSR